MAEQIAFLVIGNGIAGITAAETLRAECPEASIGIIADEDQPVYYRPALKDFLAGHVPVEKLWARPADYYHQQRIHFLVDHVIRIQPDQHIVMLRSGGYVRYGQLLLATGARARVLDCPGSELDGVMTLRTLRDYQRLQERLTTARRVVVCGSGSLALETVETLCGRGFQITHLLRKHLLWSEVLDATASDLVLQEEQRAGVDIHLESAIAHIEGTHGAVTAVVTENGERVPCELVLVAIGIAPHVDYIRASGISCRRGVLVDQYFCTSAPAIYAAGDVVETVHAETNHARLVGQWYPAIQQARSAAYSMLGRLDTTRPFRVDTFYNATFLYGLPFAAVGVTATSGYQELIAEPQPRSYRKLLLRDDVPVGFLALGDRRQALSFKRAIDAQVDLAPVLNELFQEDFDLAGWLDARGVPPLQLGVSRSKSKRPAQEQPAVTDPVSVEASDDALTNAISAVEGADIHANHVRTLPRLPATPSTARTAPGMAQLLPPAIVNALSQQPALIILPAASTQGQSLSPTVRILQPDATVSIGRVTGNDIVLADQVVSRQHAEIFAISGSFSIRDLGSSNGVMVNQSKITQPHLLAHGDHITLGTTIIIFVDLQAGSEPTSMVHTVPPELAVPASAAGSQTGQTPTIPAHVVICPHCGVANTIVARFCASCSAPLHVS